MGQGRVSVSVRVRFEDGDLDYGPHLGLHLCRRAAVWVQVRVGVGGSQYQESV